MSGIIYCQFAGGLGKLFNRFIITGGPLILSEELNVTTPLLRKLDNIITKRVIFTQFRNLFPTTLIKKDFLEQGYNFEEHLNYLINLTKNEETLWNEINPKRRNEIRKAEKTGTTVSLITRETQLNDSYKILCEVYSRARLPLLEFGIFKRAFEKSFDNEGFKAFAAFNSGNLIGTMYTLCYKGTIYDWYAGSCGKYYNKYPNDLISWEVFLWGKKNGFSRFDFGGAGKPGIQYGVRDYKKQFGGELVSFGRFEKINKPVLMKIAKTGFQIKRKLNL
jgi:lipid II:glycine glycyltransferase (peptidoglycan interpeptide bridge formation enzyme)